jgi:tRNA threonylcarbamoyladenosine biosynthesis protein TsaE
MLKTAPSQLNKTIQIESKSLQQTKQAALLVVEKINNLSSTSNAIVVLLQGDLGSGKTTFTKYLAKALGVSQTITSPTFVIFKRYSLNKHKRFNNLFHFDCYRLESKNDLEILGFEEIVRSPTNIVVLEWPENVQYSWPHKTIKINFSLLGEKSRNIIIQ